MGKKGDFRAQVLYNRNTGPGFYKLGVSFVGEGAKAFAQFRPGQFVEIDLTGAALPPQDEIPLQYRDAAKREVLLRRPFSFCDLEIRKAETAAEVLYAALGPSSLRMTTLKTGDCLNILGPLGRGFQSGEGKKLALLAVGGMGAGPLELLAKVLKQECPSLEIIAFCGAKSKSVLPFEEVPPEIDEGLANWIPEFARSGVHCFVATDDGTAGYKGFVPERVEQWLSETSIDAKKTIIYGCGPDVMLAATARLAQRWKIDCQVSTERIMACGIGLCQSCAVECKAGEEGGTIYKLCCKDGPVFDSRELVF
jgi:dihydroorotate dehydrogenase electron transfer subunit